LSRGLGGLHGVAGERRNKSKQRATITRTTETRPPAKVLAAALILALVICCLLVPAAAPAAKKRRGHARPLYWGAWIGKQLTGSAPPWDMSGVTRFEEMIGKGLSVVEFSSPFASCASSPCAFFPFPTVAMDNVRQYGAIPFFSWGSESIPWDTYKPSQPDFELSDVIAGSYDSYIRDFAEAARSWGHPFFLRFDWEMNGNWFPWGETVPGNAPGEYIAAWRHVHDIFTSVGATNATWVWCPYADPFGRFGNLRGLYPGDAYVDWTCMDGYNWGQNLDNPHPWRSFGQIFDQTYEQIVKKIAPRKPMIVAEFASTPNGGHKALWIRDMFAKLPARYPRIRGIVWFNSVERGIDFALETSLTAVRAFATGIRRPIYRTNGYRDFAESPIRPPH
jgi:mannan endo-1,4-beta-mannosidase